MKNIKRQKTKLPLFSKEQLQALLNSMDDLVFVLDKDKRFINCFQPQGELFLPIELFIGKLINEIEFPEPARSAINCAINHVDINDEAKAVNYFLPVKNELHWYNCKITKVTSFKNHSPVYLVVVRDISMLKQNEALLALQNETLREIAYIESHLLRTPLANILALLQLIGYGNFDEDSKTCFELIKYSAHNLDNLIKNIVHKANNL